MSILQHKDPVCGMKVEADQAAGTSEYHGRRVYFCSLICKEQFDRAPDSFAENIEG
jgi:YHS domain-containing protein